MTAARVLGPQEGILPGLGGVRDRIMIDGTETGGRFALVEHLFEPRALAAPMHRHRDEDEYSYVRTGRIGAILGDEEVEGGPGDLIFKPRDQWHTFWNAGDEPASCLEIISSAGLEELFRSFATLTEEPTPEALAAMAGKYGCDLDFEATGPIMARPARPVAHVRECGRRAGVVPGADLPVRVGGAVPVLRHAPRGACPVGPRRVGGGVWLRHRLEATGTIIARHRLTS